MGRANAIATTFSVVVLVGTAFVIIYWMALLIFPIIILTIVGAITYSIVKVEKPTITYDD